MNESNEMHSQHTIFKKMQTDQSYMRDREHQHVLDSLWQKIKIYHEEIKYTEDARITYGSQVYEGTFSSSRHKVKFTLYIFDDGSFKQ